MVKWYIQYYLLIDISMQFSFEFLDKSGLSTDMDVLWTQGKRRSDAFFVTNTEVCFLTGSFIKFCSTDKFSEVSVQSPPENIECICADFELNIIAIASRYIHILNYPKLEIISQWPFNRKSCIIRMIFVGDCYLLTLEGTPDFKLTVWNWKTAVNLRNTSHYFACEDITVCLMSVNPAFKKMIVFQHCNGLHFYEIGDLTHNITFTRRTLYLPLTGDAACGSILDEKTIENLTFFDKLQHDSWGIHSDLLHKLPLKIVCSQLSEHELVAFYDLLMKQERLGASCHCWLDNNRLIIACLNGTILILTSDFSLKILHLPNDFGNEANFSNYITCMAFNKNGLYLGRKNGNIYLISHVGEWDMNMFFSTNECLSQMKFSPDFKNLLIENASGTLALLNTTNVDKDIVYLSTCDDDSSIIGVYCINANLCITVKTSGLIEIWDLYSGIPISQYHLKENILYMEGCPSSSAILVSSYNTYIFIIDISKIKNPRVLQILRPSDKPIKIIKCENFGRLAFLVSENQEIFIMCILPSKGFSILGYIALQNKIIDLAVLCKSVEDIIYVAVLIENEPDTFIKKIVIPNDFLNNFKNYWGDAFGRIKPDSFDLTTINLEAKCSSIVAHLLYGFIVYHPKVNKFINIPYENIKNLDLTSEDPGSRAAENFQNCRIFLSPAHYLLLAITDTCEIIIMKSQNFDIIYRNRFTRFSRMQPCCALSKNSVLIEGFKGVITCLKYSKVQDMGEMSWTSYCQNKKRIEDNFLSAMTETSKTELTPWTIEMINNVNEDSILMLKERRDKLAEKFKHLKLQLEELVGENCSVPIEYQLEIEEFILDENLKENMLECRDNDLKKHEMMLKEKLKAKEKDIKDIKESCVDSFAQKGRVLKSFRQNAPVHNYPIPKLSKREKEEICYAFKKDQLEKYLGKLRSKEDVKEEEFTSETLFNKENEINLDFDKEIKKQPFELQSREERIDYTFILRYIIRRKRLVFNCQFKNVEHLRKDAVQKIKEINLRIKEILELIKEERTIWEPEDIDYDSYFEVSNKEIEDASSIHFEDGAKDCKGLADSFLKDDWLLKLKSTSKQKSQITLKKNSIDLLKKEMIKKHKSVDELVDHYEIMHRNLEDDKLRCDLEINQNELQLYAILFSVANYPTYKIWEENRRKDIEELKGSIAKHNKLIRQLETLLLKHKAEMGEKKLESDALDEEMKQIMKTSRNKPILQSFYDKRPILIDNTESLNPFVVKKSISPGSSLKELSSVDNKPQKISLQTWKQLCSLREKKYLLEEDNKLITNKSDIVQGYLNKLYSTRDNLRKDVIEKEKGLEEIHEMRIRCNFETPMVQPVPDLQLEIKYPDYLDFRETLFLQKFHIEGLNGIINNAGNKKLEVIKTIAETEYEIGKNNVKSRIGQLKIRDLKKEVDLVKSIPLTKDIQKIVQNPEGFRLQDRIDAFEKSKQIEVDEIIKQMNQVRLRISNIETKKDILKRSTNQKKKEIVRLKGDIAELRKIENLARRK